MREKLKLSPPFVREFMRGIDSVTSARTKLAYAGDLLVFFRFLCSEISRFSAKQVTDLDIEDIKTITTTEIHEYMEYIEHYKDSREQRAYNTATGKERKLSALRTMFAYLYKNEYIPSDPSIKVDMPKKNRKNIIRLDTKEIGNLLDTVESGNKMTAQQIAFHNKTQRRDTALITLLLGTGMRVSECVGIDLSDLNMDDCSVRVLRKGGDEQILYFGDEVEEALELYLQERYDIHISKHEQDGHENALFLSLQNRRITTRAIENLVTKYARIATPLKKITPHKLRSTFGTQLYNETGDIYLVADILGHSDVNTTRKHYAAMDEDRKREAANRIKLNK
jgi:site-specific recombinase XerD